MANAPRKLETGSSWIRCESYDRTLQACLEIVTTLLTTVMMTTRRIGNAYLSRVQERQQPPRKSVLPTVFRARTAVRRNLIERGQVTNMTYAEYLGAASEPIWPTS